MKTSIFIISLFLSSIVLSAKDSTETTWRFPIWYSPSDVDYVFGLNIGFVHTSDKIELQESDYSEPLSFSFNNDYKSFKLNAAIFQNTFNYQNNSQIYLRTTKKSIKKKNYYIFGLDITFGDFNFTNKFLKNIISPKNTEFLDNNFKDIYYINGLKFSFINSQIYKLNGLNISLIEFLKRVNGLSINLFISKIDYFNGLNVNGMYSANQRLNGVNISTFSYLYKLNGLSLGLMNIIEKSINGLQFGIINKVGVKSKPNISYLSSINGLQSGLFNYNLGNTLTGIQFGIINYGSLVYGVQAGIYNYSSINGIQIGILNNSYNIRYFQIGMINTNKSTNGISFGLFNYSKKLKGLQIGILNISNDRWMPLINWGF